MMTHTDQNPRSARRRRHRRAGITLFEVVLALVVFMVTLPALNTLVMLGTQRAEESHLLARASMECRSKLAEVTVGIEGLDSNDWSALPDNFWFWKISSTDSGITNLKQVQVSVKYDIGMGSPVQVTLSQFILDPANRGSTQDRSLLNSAAQSSGSSDSSSSGGGTTP